MTAPRLLTQLLDYIVEQDKAIDPRGYRLQSHKDFLKTPADLQGLPGVDFNIDTAGDHIWLRVSRLEAKGPPPVGSATEAALLSVGTDPFGPKPTINDAALQARVTEETQSQPAEQRSAAEARWKAVARQALAQYAPLWEAWAAGEAPRRRSISLYGDLFSLKQQLEAEETAQPREIVWGFGVSAWQLTLQERSGSTQVDFQYPLITQAMELFLAEDTLAIEVRPRAVSPRCEFDALSACAVPGTAEVERAARDALTTSEDRPVNPFDTSSFEHIQSTKVAAQSDIKITSGACCFVQVR